MQFWLAAGIEEREVTAQGLFMTKTDLEKLAESRLPPGASRRPAAKNREFDDETAERIERQQQTLEATEIMREARKRAIPKELLQEPNDPTPQRQAKDGIAEEETTQAGKRVKRVETQTMLDRYHRRGQISKDQYDAGCRLYRVFQAAGGLTRITSSYMVRLDGAPTDGLVRQVEAFERVNKALGYVGKQLSPVLVAVCLMDESARDWMAGQDESPDAGIVVLRLALDRLAEFYRRQG